MRLGSSLAAGVPPLPFLGFGGAPIGNLRTAVTDAEATAAIRRAWDRGIRYFDTAPHYGLGLSERRLGEVLPGLPRTQLVLSTKIGRLIVPNPHPADQDDDGFAVPGDLTRVWDFSLPGAERSLAESLERLRVDAVDIAFVHDPDQAGPGALEEGVRSLAALKQAGAVRAIGVGTNSTSGLAELIGNGSIDVIMLANRYTLVEHSALETVLDPAARAGVPVIAVGIYGTGLLATARPTPDASYEHRPADAEIVRRAHALAEICESHGVELPAAALAFPMLHPAVAGVVVGMRSAREVDENVDRAEVDIPAALWSDLAAEGLIPPGAVRSLEVAEGKASNPR
ncbi:aldo/keto reductase [Lysinimonas soli]|uniref:Aldo/keto reductase n=1 Tax=Lysinimonas soli TaxID=1074233 RepID=A0ABW0NQA0_9MICO